MSKNNLVYNVRQVNTKRELIETSAEEFGERTAFVIKKDGELVDITFRRVLTELKALSTYFNSLGLEGKKIAVIG